LGTEKAKVVPWYHFVELKIQGYTDAESQHPFLIFKYREYIKNNIIYWIPYGRDGEYSQGRKA